MNELTSSDSQQTTTNDRHELYAILDSRFNNTEIKGLCFRLDIDYENLSGATKKERAQELVLFMERRHGLDKLAETIQQIRPDTIASPDKKDVGSLPVEVPVVQVIEATIPPLLLTLEGITGKWKLSATNESDAEMRKVNVVLRPSSAITVTPIKIPFGVIPPGQTKQAINSVVIRPGLAANEDICILPFEVIYATPNTRPSRYKSEFHIPIASN